MRIGILSFAHLHAEGYQANLRNIPGVELVGFSDTDSERGQHFANKYNLRWFGSHEELLFENLDGAIICSENSRHRDLVEMAAQAGCQILCEKPIEVSEADALEMQKVCKANGVSFMTAFPMRFAPSTKAVRDLIRQGKLGRIYGVSGINHSEIPKSHRAWFADKKLAGGGAAMDHVVHLADLLRWYFDSEIVEVYAEMDNLFYPKEVEVDTAGLLLLKLENGVQASIDCSWSRPTWYPRWGHLKMEVLGDNGAAVMDSFAQHVNVYSKHSPRPHTWTGFAPDPNQAMVEEFIASIREKRPPSITFNDGFEAMRVALAAYESAWLKAPVELH